MITNLHHAQITVPPDAADDAKAFYTGVLGLAEIAKPESLVGRGGFWLAVGDQSVHVGTETGFDRSQTKAHLAYQVTDLARWRQTLTDYGITPIDSIPIPGFDRFECRDPFGNRLEFIQPLG